MNSHHIFSICKFPAWDYIAEPPASSHECWNKHRGFMWVPQEPGNMAVSQSKPIKPLDLFTPSLFSWLLSRGFIWESTLAHINFPGGSTLCEKRKPHKVIQIINSIFVPLYPWFWILRHNHRKYLCVGIYPCSCMHVHTQVHMFMCAHVHWCQRKSLGIVPMVPSAFKFALRQGLSLAQSTKLADSGALVIHMPLPSQHWD